MRCSAIMSLGAITSGHRSRIKTSLAVEYNNRNKSQKVSPCFSLEAVPKLASGNNVIPEVVALFQSIVLCSRSSAVSTDDSRIDSTIPIG